MEGSAKQVSMLLSAQGAVPDNCRALLIQWRSCCWAGRGVRKVCLQAQRCTAPLCKIHIVVARLQTSVSQKETELKFCKAWGFACSAFLFSKIHSLCYLTYNRVDIHVLAELWMFYVAVWYHYWCILYPCIFLSEIYHKEVFILRYLWLT